MRQLQIPGLQAGENHWVSHIIRSMSQRPKIVIVGSGFGSVYAYLELHKLIHGRTAFADIVFVSKTNYFLFTPLLHEAATGAQRQSNIIQPIRQIFGSCRCLQDMRMAEARRVDTTRKVVVTGTDEIPYDYMVAAIGSTTRLFDFDAELVYTLKNLQEAQRLKNRILEAFEAASHTDSASERQAWLQFAVIGGGPTGVELAAEISEFAGETLLKLFPGIKPEEVKVFVIHPKSELIEHYDPYLRKQAETALRKKPNLELVLSARVQTITPDAVYLNTGRTIATRTPILTAGVQPNQLACDIPLAMNQRGQVAVNEYLQVPTMPNIFAVGDMAEVKSGGATVPQTAQAAEAQGRLAGQNLARLIRGQPLQPFVYKERGQLVSLGRFKAGANLYGVTFFGRIAWWLWRTIYASKLIGWANRIRVVVDWTLDLFYPRDISKL